MWTTTSTSWRVSSTPISWTLSLHHIHTSITLHAFTFSFHSLHYMAFESQRTLFHHIPPPLIHCIIFSHLPSPFIFIHSFHGFWISKVGTPHHSLRISNNFISFHFSPSLTLHSSLFIPSPHLAFHSISFFHIILSYIHLVSNHFILFCHPLISITSVDISFYFIPSTIIFLLWHSIPFYI